MQLFLTDKASDNGGSGEKQLSRWRGRISVNHVTNTTGSGTSIQETASAGGTAQVYLSEVFQPGTNITGNMTGNLRGLESSNSANAGLGGKLDVVDATNTTVLATVLAETGFPAVITELSTSDAAKALASTAVTAYNPAVPFRLRWTTKVKNVGTMGAGFTVTTSIAGASAAAAGDSSITPPTTQTPNAWLDKPYISAVGTPAVTETVSASVAPGLPSGGSTGDLLVMFIEGWWGNTASIPTVTSQLTITGGTGGWLDSNLTSKTVLNSGNIRQCVLVAYRYVDGTEGSTFTVAPGQLGGTNTSILSAQVMLVKNGPSSGNPFDGTVIQGGTSSVSTSATISSYTPGVGKNLGISWNAQWGPTNTGLTDQGDGRMLFDYSTLASPSSGTYNYLTGYFNQDAAAATPSGSWSWDSGYDGGVVVGEVIIKQRTLPELVMAPFRAR